MKADLKTLMIIIGLMADIVVGSIVYEDLPIKELKSSVSNFVDKGMVSASKFFSANKKEEIVYEEVTPVVEVINNTIEETKTEVNFDDIVEEKKIEEKTVYDNMTLDELAEKLERSLKGTLDGTGYLFASRTTELGVDPYMAVAIVLLETGCDFDCSALVNQCYNVGGMRGTPGIGCWGGDYMRFNSLNDGINSFIDNLYYNYVAMGLTTPETINPKYAESTEWAGLVNHYINVIKSR